MCHQDVGIKLKYENSKDYIHVYSVQKSIQI
jgi:hypothetical protein